MKLLTSALNRLPEFQQLLTALEGGRSPTALSGAASVHRCHIAAGVGLTTGRPVVVVCADESEGQKLARDLGAFIGASVPVLGPRDFTFHNAAALSRQWEHRRLALMKGLAGGKYPFLVATVEGLLQRTIPRALLERCCLELKLGGCFELNELAEALSAAGYVRCEQVEGLASSPSGAGFWTYFLPAWTALSGRNSSGTRWTPWGSLTPPPSAGRKTSRPPSSSPPPRSFLNSLPAASEV